MTLPFFMANALRCPAYPTGKHKFMAPKRRSNRIDREKRTFACMLHIYCHAHHGTHQQLCAGCYQLQHNANHRLTTCPFGSSKPACGKCPHNCHLPAERSLLREIMKFAGPRMLWRHPLLALLHLWDSRSGTHDKDEQAPGS